jgi:hypothetical protein
MSDWHFAQTDPEQQLALLHTFSVLKKCPDGEVEFRITIHEYVTPREPTARFFAHADKEVNQRTAPVKPFGWGTTLLQALSECMRMIERFPYEAD